MKVCSLCNKKVLGECLNSKCKDYWKECWEKKTIEKIADYKKEAERLQKIDSGILNSEDYSELRKMKLEVKKWEKELKGSSVNSEVAKLLSALEELENKFPEKIKLKYKRSKSGGYQLSCSHNNISWDDFFKNFNEKKVEPYCLDCGESENAGFTKIFQRWYCKKIEEWLKDRGLEKYKFNSWLKKTADNHYDIWQQLKRGKFLENVKDELVTFQELSGYIENYCLEFAGFSEKKEVNLDKNEEWRMKNEEWRMKNEEWRMKNEEWRMKNEEWRMKNEEWRMKNEEWNLHPWIYS